MEVKFLDIDPAAIEAKLKGLGAKKVGDYLYRSRSFDFPGFPLDKDAAWVRLRDEGDKITVAFKKRLGVKESGEMGSDSGMEEVEVVVNDYEKMTTLFLRIGLVIKFEQEKKRIRWEKDGVEFDIDFWPRINPYLEIEASSLGKINEAALELGLNPKDEKICSATQVYKHYGINDKDYIVMTFDKFEERK